MIYLFRAVKTISRQIGTMACYALFCSKQDFSVFTTANINSLNTNKVTDKKQTLLMILCCFMFNF